MMVNLPDRDASAMNILQAYLPRATVNKLATSYWAGNFPKADPAVTAAMDKMCDDLEVPVEDRDTFLRGMMFGLYTSLMNIANHISSAAMALHILKCQVDKNLDPTTGRQIEDALYRGNSS